MTHDPYARPDTGAAHDALCAALEQREVTFAELLRVVEEALGWGSRTTIPLVPDQPHEDRSQRLRWVI